jgi:Ca2+-binding EF-hand superfamily protein
MILSPEQQQEIRDAFALFDCDGDGVISSEEIGQAMRALGLQLSGEELHKMIKAADLNCDGVIDGEEFVRLMSDYFGRVSGGVDDEVDTLREAFEVFDQERTGFIGACDIKKVFLDLGERLSDADVEAMILVADLNSDGRISFEEFRKIVNAPPLSPL